MRRWTLATAMTVLLTATACGGSEDLDGDVLSDELTNSDAPVVPVDLSTELVDPEGSVLGTAVLSDDVETDIAELEVEVSGLTAGFHGIRLFEAAGCDDLAAAPSIVLPPMLVLENGVGKINTLVGPVSLDEIVEGEGVTVVIDQAVAGLAEVGTGSQLACGAFEP
jgi:Cu-Zn family superoxide dismutase